MKTAAELRKELDAAWEKLGYSPFRREDGTVGFDYYDVRDRETSEEDLLSIVREALSIANFASNEYENRFNRIPIEFKTDPYGKVFASITRTL